MYTFAIALYSFIVRMVAPFHAKARKMLAGQKETFSVLQRSIGAKERYIWFHAASLGEFEQGRPVIEKMRQLHPEVKILLTFFSPSGYEVRKNYEGADVVCYLPFDLPKNVRRFLELAKPVMAVFIKYEFWMNYLKALHKQQIPVYIISALFRPNQLFFRPYGRSYRPVLTYYDWIFVQDESSRALLDNYSIRNVTVSGDTRFDRVYAIYQRRKELSLVERFVTNDAGEKIVTLVAGSSWPKDEAIFIDYFNRHPEIKLIVAPHEIDKEHQKNIIGKLKRPHVRYSKSNESSIRQADCLILDCYGLLSSIYRYGEVAYIGGGFGAGIHNVLEAAVYGVPVIFGPNYEKFREARELIGISGGFAIQEQADFDRLMDRLLTDPPFLADCGTKAGNYVTENLGATDLILERIGKKIEHKTRS